MKTKKRANSRELGIFLALIAICIVFSILSPQFMKLKNAFNVLKQTATVAICAVGFTFVLITGGIDLSLGYQISLDMVICAYMMKNWSVPWPLAVAVTLLLGLLIGSINGVIIIKTHVAPLIVTLSMQIILKGISFMITKGLAIFGFEKAFLKMGQGTLVGDFPISLIFVIAILCIGIFILNKTILGRYFYAIGNNRAAAKLSGVNTDLCEMLAYSFCGLFTSLGAVLLLSRMNSAQSATGEGYEFNALTGCVLGGVSSSGGKGTVIGAFIGCLIVGVLDNGLLLLNVNEYLQQVLKGCVLLAAVVYDTATHERAERIKRLKAINAEN